MKTIAPLNSGTAQRYNGRRAHRTALYCVALGAVVATMAGCGGDKKAASTTTPAPATAAPATLAPATLAPTAPPPPVSVTYVTQGAVVGVANASRVNGAAGRLTDRLAKAGFTTGTPTDYTPVGGSTNKLETTVVYFLPGDAAAETVANSVREALGGGAITVAQMGTPAPTATGELGNVTVLVAMGNDVADKTLAELQTGTTAPTTTAAAAAPPAAATTTVAPAPAPAPAPGVSTG